MATAITSNAIFSYMPTYFPDLFILEIKPMASIDVSQNNDIIISTLDHDKKNLKLLLSSNNSLTFGCVNTAVRAIVQ